jgi:hypothetical protein
VNQPMNPSSEPGNSPAWQPKAPEGTPEARAERREHLLRLLDEWVADDPAYDQETWRQLSAALVDQTSAPATTETDAQAMAWRLHTKLPLGWRVETVALDDRHLGAGWCVILHHDQLPYVVRLYRDDDVTHFFEQFGPQHPPRFETDSFMLEFHPEQVNIELAEPKTARLAPKDVIELITWGKSHLAFLTALAEKRVRCPTCGRSDCKLLWVDKATGRYFWECWNEYGHWFTSTYDFEHCVVLPDEPKPPESDIPF